MLKALLRLITRPDVRPSILADYRLPGRPPAGRTLVDTRGESWVCEPDGMFVSPATGEVVSWLTLLDGGPLTLAPLTTDEAASEVLYGPVGARWGQPDQPCPYAGCAYGQGHAGPHRDDQGDTLGMVVGPIITDPTAGTVAAGESLALVCTCHNPAAHKPGCPRYVGAPETGPAHQVHELADGSAFVGTAAEAARVDAFIDVLTGTPEPPLAADDQDGTPSMFADANPDQPWGYALPVIGEAAAAEPVNPAPAKRAPRKATPAKKATRKKPS